MYLYTSHFIPTRQLLQLLYIHTWAGDIRSKEALERPPWEMPTLRREPAHDRLSPLRTRLLWGVQAEAGESRGTTRPLSIETAGF